MSFIQYYQYPEKKDLSEYDKYFCSKNELNNQENKLIEFINYISGNTIRFSNFFKNNSLYLLENECKIIKLLAKYTLQNNYLDYPFMNKLMAFLYNISENLRYRINLKPINHQLSNNNIPRCSYKFCKYKERCHYNYSNKKNNICYQDHFVHNMVSADISVLSQFLTKKYNENKIIIPNKEILKTINTLSFVINHMYDELKAKTLYLEEYKIERYHIVKKK